MTSVPATNPASEQAVLPASQGGIDVARERAETLGAAHSHHFNAAGSALPPIAVVSKVIEHLRLEEEIGGYEAAMRVRDEVESVYTAAAELLGAAAEEIALFDSASTALRVALEAVRPAPGTRIIASSSTYVSHALHLMTINRTEDVELVIAPTAADRTIDLDALETTLADGRPSIVTIGHVPTSSGLIEPAAEVGRIANKHGATYILDATQSVGQLEIDVKAIGCHVLATTGRKFLRAPRGTALAYVDSEFAATHLPAAPDVRGSQWRDAFDWDVTPGARRFETWEASIAGRLGMGVAIRQAIDRGMEATEAWLTRTAATIREALREVPGVEIADPEGAAGAAIVTFVFEGLTPAEVVTRLAAERISAVSVPATHGQWDLGDRGIPSVVRVSPHVYNDEGDVESLIRSVAALSAEGGR